MGPEGVHVPVDGVAGILSVSSEPQPNVQVEDPDIL